jgi:hypothetical protein
MLCPYKGRAQGRREESRYAASSDFETVRFLNGEMPAGEMRGGEVSATMRL